MESDYKNSKDELFTCMSSDEKQNKPRVTFISSLHVRDTS